MPDDPKPASAILEEGVRAHDYRSEPNLDLPEYGSAPLHHSFQSSPLQLDAYPASSRTLSLKQAHHHHHQRTGKGQLPALQPEMLSSTPYKSVFSPGTLSNRNGSLSYDSLLNPSPGDAGQGAGPPLAPLQGEGAVAGALRQPLSDHHGLNPGAQGAGRAGEAADAPRAPSDPAYGHDSGIFDSPGGYGSAGACCPDGPRGPSSSSSRGPMPPAYGGSRDNLMGAGPGAYGQHTPVLRQATLDRAPRTSSSSLHTDHSSTSSGQGRSAGQEGLYRSPSHHPHTSSALPRSPSYTNQKLSYISALERTESPRLGGPSSREALMKMNGQTDCHASSKSPPPSPSRHGHKGIRKVTGVGGATYEISV
ncbi:hypothetical protein NHX12_029282 [Muraenolepis orangiensis]|uniref:Uncharacterized protein n=1 Tax=Muraenolepis orangiensis TaxID=630683 RepID=A0A9Q0IL16_9TELE|nr:hypothetical protein NHX12_029282 [Muraenolepis orangiensis]